MYIKLLLMHKDNEVKYMYIAQDLNKLKMLLVSMDFNFC